MANIHIDAMRLLLLPSRKRLKVLSTLLLLTVVVRTLLFLVFKSSSHPERRSENYPPMTTLTSALNVNASQPSTSPEQRRSRNFFDEFDDFDVRLVYPNHVTHLPHFVDDVDRKTFLADTVNRRYLERLPSAELRGRVRMLKNAVVRRNQECSWLTRENEFAKVEIDDDDDDKGPEVGSRGMTSNRTLCPLLVPDGQTFQHFVDGVLPKIVQLVKVGLVGKGSSCQTDKIANTDNDIYFVLFKPRDSIIYDLLQRLGISRRRLILVPPETSSSTSFQMRAARLVDGCVAPAVHPLLWLAARQLLLRPTGNSCSADVKQTDVVRGDEISNRGHDQPQQRNLRNSLLERFLKLPDSVADRTVSESRARRWWSSQNSSSSGGGSSNSDRLVILLSRHYTHNGGRHLLNEDDVASRLSAKFGPERVVRFGRGRAGVGWSSVRLFRRARLIVGVHGGAFYNVLFAPADCAVVEIMPLVVVQSKGQGQTLIRGSQFGYRNQSHRTEEAAMGSWTHGKHGRQLSVQLGQGRDASGTPPRGLAQTIVWRMTSALRQSFWRLYVVTSSVRGDVTVPLGKLDEVLNRLPV